MYQMWVGIGHLGRDPELVQLPSGTSELRFTLAIDDPYQDRTGNWVERVYWIPVQINIPTFVNAYANRLTKGMTVLVQGKLVTYTFTDSQGQTRNGFIIDANYIRILKRPDQQQGLQNNFQQGVPNVQTRTVTATQPNNVRIPNTTQTVPPNANVPPQTQTNTSTRPQPTPPTNVPSQSDSMIVPPDSDEFEDLPF